MFKKKDQQHAAQLDQHPIAAIISSDTTIEGNINSQSVMRIDGKVIGNISCQSGIIQGENSEINGNINSDLITIYGLVNGNITCHELLIKKGGQITGDIVTQSIQVELGAMHNGNLKMNSSSKPSTKEE